MAWRVGGFVGWLVVGLIKWVRSHYGLVGGLFGWGVGMCGLASWSSVVGSAGLWAVAPCWSGIPQRTYVHPRGAGLRSAHTHAPRGARVLTPSCVCAHPGLRMRIRPNGAHAPPGCACDAPRCGHVRAPRARKRPIHGGHVRIHRGGANARPDLPRVARMLPESNASGPRGARTCRGHTSRVRTNPPGVAYVHPKVR